MNKTIKSLKEAEKGCGKSFYAGSFGGEADIDYMGFCGSKIIQTMDIPYKQLRGRKVIYCENCKPKLQTSKQALQEMKEELEHQNEVMDREGTIDELYEGNEKKIKKIQEALGEK